ncbi:hypothetical protein BJN34_30985 [Cupriavidus necator]|uniref:Photosynthesis system II assembly factor Ycf48/Hcf136-like domain-containing protein n=1 Tax=Cupriavidus necator TaxID=106590 RepID=A0A1U9V0G0_CUPNE|nr:YCF48-related protein [Cupriavidus necator]AQV98299.1 hypothetical protein BJN34_30985 [Cupriavidus necator]
MRILVGLTVTAVTAAAAAYAFSPRGTPPLQPTRVAVERMHINTLARSAGGLVAGGEGGHILYSADQGRHWRDAGMAAQRHALITQIVFAGNRTGIAVGHEGWILRSEDGGASWQEVAFDADGGEPLMSVARLPAGQWLAVGAFGRVMRSDDDGRHWQKISLAGVEDRHLNRIVGAPDEHHWLIVGERGLVLRSDDGGQNWRTTPPFYNGSFYGAIALGQDDWLVYGMRGHVYRSTADAGSEPQWTQVPLPATASLFGSARTPEGHLLLAGQNGMVFDSADDGRHFTVARGGARATFTDLLRSPDGWLLASDIGLTLKTAQFANAANAIPPAGAGRPASGAPQ